MNFILDPAAEAYAAQVKYVECLSAASLQTDTLYDTVATFLKSHPDFLAKEAANAIKSVGSQMCP